ncbi:DUF3662 and FHA domain-containing protein [Corynebacterium auriscanis]|uniref:DUF3662 and FHA domain-containing protein n=1 Tax=Corynebacterium auriscanis TaxID=99807 RepID=UPI003CF108FD
MRTTYADRALDKDKKGNPMDLFGRFRKLDSSLQRGLDNGLARVFGGEVVPTEIDELLKQQAEEAVMTDNYGKQLAPCFYTVLVSADDHESLIQDRPNLESDLADRLTRFTRNNGWTTPQPITVEIVAHRNLHSGQLRARSLFGEPDRRSSSPDAPTASSDASAQASDQSANGQYGADEQGGSPDGSYPDSYPGQQLSSPAQWPQRNSNGQRSATAREYDAHDSAAYDLSGRPSDDAKASTNARGFTDDSAENNPTSGSGHFESAPGERVYEDTAFSQATYREPDSEYARSDEVSEKPGENYARESATNSPSTSIEDDRHADDNRGASRGNRGLADVVRPSGAHAAGMGSAFAASAGSASAGNADAVGADVAGADAPGASAGHASAGSAGNADAADGGSAGAASAGAGASTAAPQNNDSHNDNDHARRAHGDSLSANEGWDGDQGGVDGTESPTPDQPQAQQPSYPGTEIIAQAAPDTPVNGGEGYADQESDMRVILHLRDGSDRKYWLQEGSNIIGRGNGVDLRIPDTGVSRQHADIVWDGYDAVLTDLNSTNGTTVNDTPVENWLLADGDLIVVGHSEILVRFTQN